MASEWGKSQRIIYTVEGSMPGLTKKSMASESHAFLLAYNSLVFIPSPQQEDRAKEGARQGE